AGPVGLQARPWPDRGRRPYAIVTGDDAMMPPHAAATGVPGHHERVHAAATAARRRPRQRHRDPLAAPPTHRAAAPTRRAAGPVRPDRSDVAGHTAAPATKADPTAPAAAGPTRHGPHLAPRPHRAPPRHSIAATAPRPTPHAALDPGPDAAPDQGERQLGVS